MLYSITIFALDKGSEGGLILIYAAPTMAFRANLVFLICGIMI